MRAGVLFSWHPQMHRHLIHTYWMNISYFWKVLWTYSSETWSGIHILLHFMCMCVRKISAELISAPVFLYFVCGMPPQHGWWGIWVHAWDPNPRTGGHSSRPCRTLTTQPWGWRLCFIFHHSFPPSLPLLLLSSSNSPWNVFVFIITQKN